MPRERTTRTFRDRWDQRVCRRQHRNRHCTERRARWRAVDEGRRHCPLCCEERWTDGLMGKIGEWVLEQACREATTWPPHLIVAVNLSPVEFLRNGLTDRIAGILDAVGLPADRLELEITESVLLERTTDNLDVLNTLEVLGIRIALDDFGTHYSSLTYLKNFPFDTIKIDKYFIKDIQTNRKCQIIVQFIIELAHGLGMFVTAEGVENAGEASWLERKKCDRLQGFLLGAPMPAEAIRDFLRQSSFALQA
ncbi:EAL domain-containing protein [Rhizobium giardinii]|uniref:EAL domain-containing protein n=1 Tax=Rhizobium giardinii TaxID=56731 RepID=UPI0039E1CB11